MDDQRGFRQVFGAGVPDGEFPLDDELCPDLSDSDGCLDEAIDPHDLGVLGERLAAAYLQRRGFELLEANYRCRFGEADLIAQIDDETVLVEVKTRQVPAGMEEGIPELAVDFQKRQRYRNIALSYMLQNGDVRYIRFDVIAINVTGTRCAHLRHLVAAYAWDE
ncbi:YraN family protein [uncultured Olsenella sp.]|uniref:YraN family protein n=1 Tax=uncultured Olsenella sp. TaxID=190764 RepID=UPI0026DC6815|nr:YraN family protein [uncultured Olsenella sp.]